MWKAREISIFMKVINRSWRDNELAPPIHVSITGGKMNIYPVCRVRGPVGRIERFCRAEIAQSWAQSLKKIVRIWWRHSIGKWELNYFFDVWL